jgi:NTP pyrophosphatase (non-canonical NTP hydrolase)
MAKKLTLNEAVQIYYDRRGLKFPDDEAALLFLISEVGELADAVVSQQPGWIRNDPDKQRIISDEIGDVLMMLTAFSINHGIDPYEAMLAKFRKKGYDVLADPEA